MRKTVIFSALAAILATGHVAAQDIDIPAAIEARQTLMKAYAANLAVIGGMAQGRVAYDAQAASAAASALAELAASDQSALWPEGSSADAAPGAKALGAIWDNAEDFAARQANLATASAAFAEVAGGGLEALQAGARDLMPTCGACHQSYRQ